MKKILFLFILIRFCDIFLFRSFVKGVEVEEEKKNHTPHPFSQNELKSKLRDEFDWIAYLELNPDLGKKHYSTRKQAVEHYLRQGYSEGRVFPSLYPNQPGYSHAMNQLKNFITQMDQRNIPKSQRTFVIFHVGYVDNSKYSSEVVINNLKIFNYSMVQDPPRNSSNFYWFNVIGSGSGGGRGGGGREKNYLESFVPAGGSGGEARLNVARLEWSASPSDILTHLRTLNLVKSIVEEHFGSVFFINNGVRGPMVLKKNGLWLQAFRELLSDKNHVGIAGPTYSCEVAPHVQSHAFILRSSLISGILAHYNTSSSSQKLKDWQALIRHYEVGISQFLLQKGWKISSLLYHKRLGKNSYDGKCIQYDNPYRWCHLQPEEVIFYKFGGDILRVNGKVCDTVREYMRKEIIRLSEEEMKKELLILPETTNGGPLFDLFKQYDLELQRNYEAKKESQKLSSPIENRKDSEADKVCFLIHTTKLHDEQQTSPYGVSASASGSLLQDIIASLIRQTDPNWEAFFFVIDEEKQHFEARLKMILNDTKDARLTFLDDVPLKDLLSKSSTEAAFIAIDEVLRMLMHREDCRWFSASNADTIYGSEVVERVRNAINNNPKLSPDRNHYQSIPDLVITPSDHRKWAEIDYVEHGSKSHWNEKCVSIISNLQLNLYAATIQPRPILDRIDLTATFFHRQKLLAEDLFLRNFTNPHQCPGNSCQGGYFIEYLVKHRFWSYRRLAIDGLKSIVFHGPSPSWCIAAGNVWFDHPEADKVRCYSQKTVNTLRLQNTVFDWDHFDKNDRVCLRLSHYGFDQTYLST